MQALVPLTFWTLTLWCHRMDIFQATQSNTLLLFITKENWGCPKIWLSSYIYTYIIVLYSFILQSNLLSWRVTCKGTTIIQSTIITTIRPSSRLSPMTTVILTASDRAMAEIQNKRHNCLGWKFWENRCFANIVCSLIVLYKGVYKKYLTSTRLCSPNDRTEYTAHIWNLKHKGA